MMHNQNIEAILEALEASDTLDALQEASEQLRDTYKIAHIVYHWVDSAGDQYGCGTYSEAWRTRYLEQNYLRVDPVIMGCYQRFHPVDWKRLDWSSKAARAFLTEAIIYGVGNQGFQCRSVARTASLRSLPFQIIAMTRLGPASHKTIAATFCWSPMRLIKKR